MKLIRVTWYWKIYCEKKLGFFYRKSISGKIKFLVEVSKKDSKKLTSLSKFAQSKESKNV